MRQHLRVAIGAAVLGVALATPRASTAAAAEARGDESVARGRALAARNESLRHQLELAEGDAFYLLLDAKAEVLTLMYKGAPLRETRIHAADFGEPRARHRDSDDEAIDLDAIWTGGALEPPRIDVREEVVPPPLAGTPAADAAVAAPAPQGEFLQGEEPDPAATPVEPLVEEVEIPKTPEELYPVPAAFEIRFAEGLTLEVVRAEKPAPDAEPDPAKPAIKSAADGEAADYPMAPGPTLWERIRRLLRQAVLARPEGERARMRIVIDPLEADRLFRSLPPDVKLLIVSPSQAL